MHFGRLAPLAFTVAAACGSAQDAAPEKAAPRSPHSMFGVVVDVTDVATGKRIAGAKTEARLFRPAPDLPSIFAPITMVIATTEPTSSPLRFVLEIEVDPASASARTAKVDFFEIHGDEELSLVMESRMTKNQLRLCDAPSPSSTPPAPCSDRARLAKRLDEIAALQAPRHAARSMVLSAAGRAHEELTLASPARRVDVDLELY